MQNKLKNPILKSQTVGILTGMTYQSGIEYYRYINEEYMKQIGVHNVVAPNPQILQLSINNDTYHYLLKNNNFEQANKYIVDNLEILSKQDIVVLACNTGHMAYNDIIEKYQNINFLHIADALAVKLKEDGISKVGLLGTYATMKQNFIKGRLLQHKIETVIPQSEEELQKLQELIITDLNYGKHASSTYEYFENQIKQLKNQGAQGIILGCTEIEYLLTQSSLHNLNLYPTAKLHQKAIVSLLLNQKKFQDFQPLQK